MTIVSSCQRLYIAKASPNQKPVMIEDLTLCGTLRLERTAGDGSPWSRVHYMEHSLNGKKQSSSWPCEDIVMTKILENSNFAFCEQHIRQLIVVAFGGLCCTPEFLPAPQVKGGNIICAYTIGMDGRLYRVTVWSSRDGLRYTCRKTRKCYPEYTRYGVSVWPPGGYKSLARIEATRSLSRMGVDTRSMSPCGDRAIHRSSSNTAGRATSGATRSLSPCREGAWLSVRVTHFHPHLFPSHGQTTSIFMRHPSASSKSRANSEYWFRQGWYYSHYRANRPPFPGTVSKIRKFANERF